MARARSWRLALVFTLLVTSAAAGEQELAIRVTPQICYEGCDVHVTVRLQRDADNRTLTIEADSPDFFRASRIELPGDDAPVLHTLRLRTPPSGVYVVRATLVRANGGERSSVAHLRILGTPGELAAAADN